MPEIYTELRSRPGGDKPRPYSVVARLIQGEGFMPSRNTQLERNLVLSGIPGQPGLCTRKLQAQFKLKSIFSHGIGGSCVFCCSGYWLSNDFPVDHTGFCQFRERGVPAVYLKLCTGIHYLLSYSNDLRIVGH